MWCTSARHMKYNFIYDLSICTILCNAPSKILNANYTYVTAMIKHHVTDYFLTGIKILVSKT